MPEDSISEDQRRFLAALGKRFRARRLALRLSQEAVAERSGMPGQQTKISQIELGVPNSQIWTFAKLARGLETDLGTLLADLPEPPEGNTDRL